MIAPIPGWSWELRDGGVSLVPPEGPRCGGIRYRERVRPLRSVMSLLRAQDTDPSFRVTAVSRPERLVTDEGEYAALVTVDGLLRGEPVQRTMGYVFGDDFYAHVAGLALQRDQFPRFAQVVRDLVLSDSHLLGMRRRRYLFAPPEGWWGLERSFLEAHYYPPEAPRDPGVLVVYPAIPLPAWKGDQVSRHVQPPGRYDQADVAGPTPIKVGALSGTSFRISARRDGRVVLARELLALTDDRYVYPLSMDMPPDRREDYRRTLRAVASSIQPLPRQGTRHRGRSGTVMGHWG